MRGVALSTFGLIASCGEVFDTPDPGSTQDDAVSITITQNWLNDRGEVTSTSVITDLAVTDVVARIPEPEADGGFETRSAEMTATGMVLRNVPPNTTYYLDVRSFGSRLLFVTDVREIDAKFYSVGRRDPAQPTVPTSLTLNVANMAEWQDGDSLGLYCANIDAFGRLAASQSYVQGWPAAGDRQLALTVDWAQVDRGLFRDRMTPLIDGNMGDSLVISHIRRSLSTTQYVYDAPLETFTFASFTQRDGVNRTLDGGFTAAAKDAVHFDLKRLEFERYVGDVHPGATTVPGFLGGGGVAIHAQANDPRHERLFSPFAPTLLFTLFNAESSNLDMGQMVFPRPPESWSQWLRVSHDFQVIRDTPLGLKQTAVATIGVAAPIMPATAPTDIVTHLEPRISPPRKPFINSTSFHDPQVVALQPTRAPIRVTWDAPLLIDAAPTTYALAILQITRTGTELTSTSVATIFRPASDRSLAIPWQLFPGPGYYYFVLTAASDAGLHDPKFDDIGRTDSTADTISGILTLQ